MTHCTLYSSVRIWQIHFICGTHRIHDVAMCRVPFPGQKIKDQVKQVVRNFCCVRSVASFLFHRITSYVIHTQPTKWRCVAHHFWVKRSMVKVSWIVRSFSSVRFISPSLFDRFTSYVVHAKPMRWWRVALHLWVKSSKVKVPCAVRSFSSPRSIDPSLSDRFSWENDHMIFKKIDCMINWLAALAGCDLTTF